MEEDGSRTEEGLDVAADTLRQQGVEKGEKLVLASSPLEEGARDETIMWSGPFASRCRQGEHRSNQTGSVDL